MCIYLASATGAARAEGVGAAMAPVRNIERMVAAKTFILNNVSSVRDGLQ